MGKRTCKLKSTMKIPLWTILAREREREPQIHTVRWPDDTSWRKNPCESKEWRKDEAKDYDLPGDAVKLLTTYASTIRRVPAKRRWSSMKTCSKIIRTCRATDNKISWENTRKIRLNLSNTPLEWDGSRMRRERGSNVRKKSTWRGRIDGEKFIWSIRCNEKAFFLENEEVKWKEMLGLIWVGHREQL